MEPKAKKFCRLPKPIPLPIIIKNDDVYQIQSTFNGFSVVVEDEQDMKRIISMGYFGKANFSRSYPLFKQPEKIEIIRNRQFDHRKKWFSDASRSNLNKVITVPDSDSENESYFVDLQPKFELDRSGIEEKVFLLLEEAFFLLNAVKCLKIKYEKRIIEESEAWQLFSETDNFFQTNYLVYYYFRSKNWVVKPGIKFGGDYLLYKEGPPFYHASYLVLINVLNDKFERISRFKQRSMDVAQIVSLNRLCETAAKELLICEVILKNTDVNYANMNNIDIKVIEIKRWISTQE